MGMSGGAAWVYHARLAVMACGVAGAVIWACQGARGQGQRYWGRPGNAVGAERPGIFLDMKNF